MRRHSWQRGRLRRAVVQHVEQQLEGGVRLGAEGHIRPDQEQFALAHRGLGRRRAGIEFPRRIAVPCYSEAAGTSLRTRLLRAAVCELVSWRLRV